MLSPTKRKPLSTLGIDIGTTSVNIIELLSESQSHIVLGYGHSFIPQAAMNEHIINDIDLVASLIREVISDVGISSKGVVIAIPDTFILTYTIQVHQDLSEYEVEEWVVLETEKFIPSGTGEVNIDFKKLGSSLQNPTMHDVLIVAARTEVIKNRLEVIHRAGLKTVIVDVESYAIERIQHLLSSEFSHNPENQLVQLMQASPFLMKACGLALRSIK